ncbi:MAG: TAXI family TRAP transporter solute-binding subunit [Acidobacteriota bacterium]
MKTALRLQLMILVLALTAACGPSETPSDGTAEPAAEKRFLSFGTAPTGGTFFIVGSALADVADEHVEQWTVSAEATAGSRENIRRLIQGDLDFALSNAAISYFGVRGESTWDKAYPIRAVMTLAPNVALFITKQDSGIESIADLRDKRVVVGPAGAGFEMFVGPLVEAHGLTYEDFTPLNATQTGAVDLLTDGSAAAAFLGGAVPTASITQAASSMEIRLVPFDEEVKAGLINDYAFFAPATIPADTYRGQDSDYAGFNVGSMHLITAESVPEETVYQLTKTIYENRAAVVERHPAGRAIQEKNVVRDTGTPFHPGAIRYYREIGIWPEDAAEGASEGAGESGVPAQDASTSGEQG